MNRLTRLAGSRVPVFVFGVAGVVMLVAGLALGAVLVRDRLLVVGMASVGRLTASVSLSLAGTMCVLSSVVLDAVGRLGTEIESRTEVLVGDPGLADPLVRRRSAKRALLVLVLPGIAALLVGLSWGGWALYLRMTRMAFFSGTYVASASCCLAGLVLVLAGVTLSALRDVTWMLESAG